MGNVKKSVGMHDACIILWLWSTCLYFIFVPHLLSPQPSSYRFQTHHGELNPFCGKKEACGFDLSICLQRWQMNNGSGPSRCSSGNQYQISASVKRQIYTQIMLNSRALIRKFIPWGADSDGSVCLWFILILYLVQVRNEPCYKLPVCNQTVHTVTTFIISESQGSPSAGAAVFLELPSSGVQKASPLPLPSNLRFLAVPSRSPASHLSHQCRFLFAPKLFSVCFCSLRCFLQRTVLSASVILKVPHLRFGNFCYLLKNQA